jgi:hypothetical protein
MRLLGCEQRGVADDFGLMHDEVGPVGRLRRQPLAPLFRVERKPRVGPYQEQFVSIGQQAAQRLEIRRMVGSETEHQG